jgi:hypothetical protein
MTTVGWYRTPDIGVMNPAVFVALYKFKADVLAVVPTGGAIGLIGTLLS